MKKKRWKQILSVFLVALMVLTICPITAFAAPEAAGDQNIVVNQDAVAGQEEIGNTDVTDQDAIVDDAVIGQNEQCDPVVKDEPEELCDTDEQCKPVVPEELIPKGNALLLGESLDQDEATGPIKQLEIENMIFLEGDLRETDPGLYQYPVWETFITVALDNGEVYTDRNWEILNMLWDTYPDENIDGGIVWEESDDTSNAKAGDVLNIKYCLSGGGDEGWTIERTYTATIIENPIKSMEVNASSDFTHFEGNTNSRLGFEDPETGEWDDELEWEAYDTYPHDITVVTTDDEIFSGDWWDVRNSLGDKYNVWFNDYAEGDDQAPGKPFAVGDHPIIFHLGPATVEYTVSVIPNPIVSVTAVGRKILEGDKDTRNEWWNPEIDDLVFEDWRAYGTWPETLTVVTREYGEKSGDPNEVRDWLEATVFKTGDFDFGDRLDDQSPENQWTEVKAYPGFFTVCGVGASYETTIVANPVETVQVEDVVVFYGDTRTESWWDNEKQQDVEYTRYDAWPRNVTVTLKDGYSIDGETVFTSDTGHAYDKVSELVGFRFNQREIDDQRPGNTWQVGDHEATFVFAGIEAPFTVHVQDAFLESLELLQDKEYHWEGDTYIQYGWQFEGEDFDPDYQWERYGYGAQVRAVVRESAIKNGQDNVFEGNLWDVRRRIAEAMELNEDTIPLRTDDDQTPDQPWTVGEHPISINFAGIKKEAAVVIVPFPVEKVEAEKVLRREEDKVDYLDRWLDSEGEKQWGNQFEGYNVYPDQITITYKNGVKKTLSSWEEIVEEEDAICKAAAEELGVDYEELWFENADWSNQSPENFWGPGRYKALFVFGPATTEYPVVILGENGDYTGIANDAANNRYVYLEDGFINEEFSGLVEGQVADVINGKFPSKTTYIKDSSAKWYVQNGVVKKDDPGLKSVMIDGKAVFVCVDAKGQQDVTKVGFVDFEGGTFYVLNGVLLTNKSGLTQAGAGSNDWYFCANGQVQKQKTGIVLYNGSSFYVSNGKLDTSVNGFFKYDTGLFFVSKGRVVKAANGLVQDPNNKKDWYFCANGQVLLKKTGVVIYNKAGFYVKNGKLDTSYNGTAKYNGKTVNIKNGRMV